MTPLELNSYLGSATPDLKALHAHASSRGAGEIVDAAILAFADGATATVALTSGRGGRVGLVVSDSGLPDGGFVMSFDADGVLEISNPGFMVRFVPGGEMVEGWEAHSSCKTSHCIDAAINFWFDSWGFEPVAASIGFFCPHCDAGEPEDLNPVNRAACLACVTSFLPILIGLIPISMASVEECVLNDPCNWCRDASCGSDEVLGISCVSDFADMSPDHDFVVIETVDVYYCSHPDEYRRCETRTEYRLVEGCPWGCEFLGPGGSCASPPPTCDPAECELSEPVWPAQPYCEFRPQDGTWALLMDYRERACQPVQPIGEACVEGQVTRVLEVCPFGCSEVGYQCAPDPGTRVMLRAMQPAGLGSDAYVPCAACLIQLTGPAGSLEGTTAIDGTVAFEALGAGTYEVRYGCGPTDLGPHLPADLILHPDAPVNWIAAAAPRMDTSVGSANVVVPFDESIDILLGVCG